PAPLAAGSAAFVLLAGLGGAAPLPAQQGWPVPPALHGAEYTVVLAAAAALAPEALPAAYGLLAALVWHHYDTVYRVRSQGRPPGDLLVLAGGGFDGRTLAMAALASAGPRALRGGLRASAVTLGGLFVGESLASWRRYLGRQQQKGIA
ncbi:MAG: DUF5941 domain-containing protein, partial [Actinomycetota bacterium]|nr:DUF5941 domain-containing protein [Actinomycetota bacterium]